MREPRYPLPRVVLCIHDKVGSSPPHTHRERGVRQQTTTFSFRFLGVIHAGGCLFCHGDTGSHVTETGRRRGAMMRPHPLLRILDNMFTGRSARQVSTMILPQDQPGSIPSRRPSRMVLNTLPRQGRGHNEARASFVVEGQNAQATSEQGLDPTLTRYSASESTIEHRCTDVVESCRSTHSGHRARLRSTKQPQGHLTDKGWQYIQNSIDLGTQHRIPIAPLGLDDHKGRTLKSSAARQFDA
ncbi:hypothetical protein V6N13_050268 [Hibiscus sabdariffa]